MIVLSRWWWAVSEQNHQLNQKPNIAGSTWNPKPAARFLSYTLSPWKCLHRTRMNHWNTHKMHLEEIKISPVRSNKAARKAGWRSTWILGAAGDARTAPTWWCLLLLRDFSPGFLLWDWSWKLSASILTSSGRKYWLNKACAVSKLAQASLQATASTLQSVMNCSVSLPSFLSKNVIIDKRLMCARPFGYSGAKEFCSIDWI